MRTWNELSMAEKADVMKLAIEGGVYDLDAIRGGYNEYAKGGKIHIDPSKKGTFTAAASRHGKSVQQFASQVLAHPENYSLAMRKKANFARNAAKWKHALGGPLQEGDDYPEGYWENRREHSEVRPQYKRTKKDDEYWEEKNRRNARAAEEFNRRKGVVMSALSDTANSVPFTGSEVTEAAEAQRQEKLDKAHELKMGLDATMTAAELLAAGYGVTRGLTHLNRYIARQATQSTGQAISRDAMRNLAKWNRRVARIDKPQVLMNGIGGTADAYQWYTADNNFDAWENGLETGANAAGVIGGMNWFRNLPYLRRIGGDKIDAVLDGLGYGAASWDVVKNLPPLSGALEGIREQTINNEQKALGGNLYGGDNPNSQQMQFGSAYWQQQAKNPVFTEELAEFNRRKAEEDKQRRARFQRWAETKGREMVEKRTRDYTTASNDNTWIEKNNGRSKNPHLTDRAIEGAKQWATNDKAFREEHPVMATVGDVALIAPFALATAPITVPVGDALAGTALGQLATRVLTHPIAEAIGTSIAGGHGLSDLISGNANEFTALELAPLAFPYGNFAKGASEAINYAGNRVPAPIKDAWNNRAEILAQTFGTEGKTWAKVTNPKGKEGIVFLNNNDVLKGMADWGLHPIQTYRNWSQGFYPMTRKGWKSYLRKERDAMDFAKQKSIELNDAQLQQRLSLQPETFLDNKQRNTNATIKIIDDPNNVFSWPRAPRNASEVANNVRVISRDRDVSYGGKWFDPKFGTGTAAVSHPDKNVIVLPRHDQTRFSNMLMTMPSRGYTSPIDTRMHTYVHELQHQMQQNLPLLNLSQWDDATQYYVPYDHFLRNIDSESVLQPFKDTAAGDPRRYWYASPNEYNAESNAYRVVDDYNGRRDILDPLDNMNAYRANVFGLNFDQTEALWNMGYNKGGKLRKK